jgi:hypothetical protein
MRLISLTLAMSLSLRAQAPDLYPQVRALVLEAEANSTNMRLLKDRSNPHTWAGDILAHAGYLADAERVYAKSPGPSPGPPYMLFRAWVVYGNPERAEKLLESTTSPEKKATYLIAFADLLWRTGQAEEARARFEAARVAAAKIADPATRKQRLSAIDQGLRFVSDPPPDLISATPHPRPRIAAEDSPIPAFPITTDGFQDVDPKEATIRVSADSEFMKRLYDRVAAGDRAGIERITASAATPFQKALGMASLEHLLIQLRQPDLAEDYAKQIPETDSASSLAKAEAISAAGVAWHREREDARARTDFATAKRIVLAVPDLPLGRISVLLSVAIAECKGGMAEEGHSTFGSAMRLAQNLPVRPRPAADGHRAQTPIRVHYRDEALKKVFRAAVHAHDFRIADDAAALWSKTDDTVGSEVVNAWFSESRIEEAIAAARRIGDPDQRVSALLSLARSLLEEQGAPVF